MKFSNILSTTALLSCLATTSTLYAKSDHDHGHRQHDAHLHGTAELMLAISNDSVEISLESPAANIVGFEHRATSAKQKHAAEEAHSMLESASKLFAIQGGSCTLTKADVDMSAIVDVDEDHGHREEHKHHGESEQHHEDHEETHSEISATYHYQCKAGADIREIQVNLHKHFGAIEKINAMWLTEEAQGAIALTAKSNSIEIR